MKRSVTNLTALCLAAALISGITALAAINARAEGNGGNETPTIQKVDAARTDTGTAAEKDETVYILANADGSVGKIIVSDWLKNPGGADTITDVSRLSDIENVKGDETFTSDGDKRVWNTAGGDIYYQGTTDSTLPVEMAVTYTLDGKAVTPEEIAGKSGRVTIRFDYTNNQYEEMDIGGVKERIYVPFAVLTGVLLDNETFTNVEVTNGRLINDGDRCIVVGLSLPGMQENLGVPSSELEIPSYVEVAADAEDFKLSVAVAVATNQIFNGLDTESFEDIDALDGDLDKLSDGMSQLLDGSDMLYEGLNELLEKSGELSAGADELYAGAQALNSGAGELNDGAARLKAGAGELAAGLNTLDANSGALNAGAEQVFKTLLAAANTQLAAAGVEVPTLTPENYAQVLEGAASSIEDAANAQAEAAVRQAVEAQREYIEQQVTEAVLAQVKEKVVMGALNMDAAGYDAAVAAGAVDDNTRAAVDAAIAQQMGTQEIKALIAANTQAQIDKAVADNMASPEVQSQLAAVQEGVRAIAELEASLDSYNTFYTGLQTYTAGVSQAAQGASALNSGADELKSGTEALHSGSSQLLEGVSALRNSTPALVDGVKALRDGAGAVRDGLAQINDQGIEKLTDLFEGRLDELLVRFRATRDVSRAYRSFAGISDGMDGQVKFIYRTGAVG